MFANAVVLGAGGAAGVGPPITKGECPQRSCAARSAGTALAAMMCVAGCGGGAPLLHGAHALPAGGIAAGAGLSGTFATGDAAAAVRSARALPAAGALDAESQNAAARGEAVLAALAPSVAPWAAVRYGFPTSNEAGLTYAGRVLRLDFRHAFEDDSFALSIGGGVSAVVGAKDRQDVPASEFHVAPSSTGFDVPLLAGWRSTAGVVSLWGGVRGGVEWLKGDASLDTSDPLVRGRLDLSRWYAGGVFGLGLGFRHLHGAIELDSYYQKIEGSIADYNVSLSSVTITPAAALVATF
ncbi:MAG TPA: hypothetical protein VF881_11705 [Polyangiaceae bacterium]